MMDFIKIAMKDPKVGAFTASSQYVARKIARKIKSGQKCIIEYGAGDGVITRELLNRLSPDGRLIAFELNKDFLLKLKTIIDPRLSVINDDVVALPEHLKVFGVEKIDVVVSGIPFSFLKPALRDHIIQNTHNALREGGMFIVYQYSPMVFPLLKKYFTFTQLHFELINFPPYFIMIAEK
ncbi:methyltransferase domain-containing protein [Patescibacteria group bacterium]|nr:methyltransferase domain-containing protein [Patescibacteria group bacterium]